MKNCQGEKMTNKNVKIRMVVGTIRESPDQNRAPGALNPLGLSPRC